MIASRVPKLLPYAYFTLYVIAYCGVSWFYYVFTHGNTPVPDPILGILFGPLFGLQYTGKYLNTSVFWVVGTVIHLILMLGLFLSEKPEERKFFGKLALGCWFGIAFLNSMRVLGI